MFNNPLVICLTPVKNEAWILDRFIQCASLWADHIIIADQMSTDGSREIALKYPKVQLLINNQEEYNEQQRQKILIEAARQIPANGKKKLLITLDADECISANFNNSNEWQQIVNSHEGTIIYFPWINLRPDFQTYWQAGNFGWGFMDDGKSTHDGHLIHSPRIPIPKNTPKIMCQDIKVLHYQYTDWNRMMAKHRWYQCFEILNRPHLHPLSIFRMYHHMFGLKNSQIQPIHHEWFDFYEKQGINMLSVQKENTYYWDRQLESYFEKFGARRFALLNIWQKKSERFADPRRFSEKLLHKYLLWSQVYFNYSFPIGTVVRYFDKLLKWIF